jgi:prolyl-tRNA synthetase
VPYIVIAGRGAADGVVEVWDRRSGERNEIPATEALAWLTTVTVR